MSVLYPSVNPRLTASIFFELEGSRPRKLVDIKVFGDTYSELEADAVKQIAINVASQMKVGAIDYDVQFANVKVCGSLPEGKEFCLPVRFSGILSEIIDAAGSQLRQLFHELYVTTASEQPDSHDPHTLLDRALVRGVQRESRLRLGKRSEG